MATRTPKTALFLCTGNYYRSRFAEIVFNSVAAKMGLPWQASSRALALERGSNNVGSMDASAQRALEAMGIQAAEACARPPAAATPEDFENAAWIVALSDEEHRPLLLERFPTYADKAEYWQVADLPEVLPRIEREVMDLVARLLVGGKQRRPSPPAELVVKLEPRNKGTVRVGRETKGRRGKGVTTIFDVPVDEQGLKELAARLKEKCGTGGTVKDGCIEIQGDQRERVAAELEKMGYKVKRTGG